MASVAFVKVRLLSACLNWLPQSWKSSCNCVLIIVIVGSQLFAQIDWVTQVRQQVTANDLKRADEIVTTRLRECPDDLEAQTWHARILSWTGHLPEAENLYQQVARRAPTDVDVLLGLADVLFWEGKLREASGVLDHAEQLQPSSREIAEHRTRVQAAIRDQNPGATRNDRGSVSLEPGPTDVYRYSVLVGSQADLFNYSDAAQTQNIGFSIKWNSHWNSSLSGSSYRRIGQAAEQLSAGVSFRPDADQSFSVSLAEASHQQIAPIRQITVDYDRGTHWHIGVFRGLEFTAHSSAVWFDGSRLSILGASAVAYLPKDWWLTLTANAARTKFVGLTPVWSPSWSTKISAPVSPRLRAEAGFGVGAENYSSVDQIGRISARTYAAGAHYALTTAQSFSTFMAYQLRPRGVTQTSIGGGYALRF